MKKLAVFSALIALVAAGSVQAQEKVSAVAEVGISAPVAVPKATTYKFGDFRSSTLMAKAWQALSEKNLDAVLAYTGKCVELYGEKARAMQAGVRDFPSGDEQKIFSFWALNDVSTCIYIQAEAYRQAGKADDAKKAFGLVVKDFSFGQAYDPSNKSFWKPVDAAKEKLEMMAKGLDLDFGDMKSSTINKKAWEALAKKDMTAVLAYVNKNLELYSEKAKVMQASLTEFPWESQEKIFSFWALNDVGTSLFILGQSYRNAGKNVEAVAAFKQLISDYSFSQCWDPQGWFWKPAEAAQTQILEIEAVK